MSGVVVSMLGFVLLGGGLLASPAFAGAQTAARDPQLAVRVKTALVNDLDLGTMPIDVLVRDAAVTLRGVVRSAADADRAVALARDIDGVASVRSELDVDAVEPPPRVPPTVRLPALGPPRATIRCG